MSTKIKVASSLPTKRKIAEKIGATAAEIESVNRLLAKPLPLDYIIGTMSRKARVKASSSRKAFSHTAAKKKTIKSKVACSYILFSKSNPLNSRDAIPQTLTIKDLIAYKRKQ